MTAAYLIRPVTAADLAMLAGWRARPHVARWWGPPEVEPEGEKLTDAKVAMWIAERAGRPFAFIQDYRVHDWTPHPFDYLPPGARGMDLYVAETDMIGMGHGAALVGQHVARMFAEGVPAVGIDPHPENHAARRAYAKAGFMFHAGPMETPWGVAVLMHRYASGDSESTSGSRAETKPARS